MKVSLEIDGRDPAAFRVSRFAVDEALSSVHRMRVEANVEQAVDPEDLLDRKAALEVDLWGSKRRFQGVVVAAEVEAVREDVLLVRVEVAPKLILADLGRSSYVFQDHTVKEIVSTILDAAGVDDPTWELQETHPKRPFVLQEQESDLRFALRLLGEEGIAFSFTDSENGEGLVFFDDSTRAAPIKGESLLHDRAVLQGADEAVWEVVQRRVRTSDSVVMKDYDMRRPTADLTAQRAAQGAGGREAYLHPGGYVEESEGKRRARARLEQLIASANAFAGKSSCLRFQPGRTFTLQSCPNAAANAEHFLTLVRHKGFTKGTPGDETWAYHNDFESIPADVPWRPAFEQRANRGPELAVVTVPPGEEIHCDEYGRVKVRFLWERSGPSDDRSSHWLRVGQLALGGSLVLPRKGFEVIVDYEQGDPDRPFVAGHLYNGDSPPPYELPGGKTRSSFQSATTHGGGGANELRFEDTAGSEEIFFNASKDMSVSAHDGATQTFGNDRKVSVGASRKLTVGQDHLAQVTGNRTLSVASNCDLKVAANYSDGVGGSQSVSVAGMRKVDVGGDKVDSVKGSFQRKVGAMQATTAIVGVKRKTVGSAEVQVAAAWTEAVAGNRKSSCGGNRTETTGAIKLVKAKQARIAATSNLVINAAGALSTKCARNRSDTAARALVLSAAAGLSVKADSITIEAKKKIELRAGAVKLILESDGTVLVKAPTIDLRGVKELAQALHKSN